MSLIALLCGLSEKDGRWHFYRNSIPPYVKDAAGKAMGVNLMRRWTGRAWQYRDANEAEAEEGESWDYW